MSKPPSAAQLVREVLDRIAPPANGHWPDDTVVLGFDSILDSLESVQFVIAIEDDLDIEIDDGMLEASVTLMDIVRHASSGTDGRRAAPRGDR